MSKFKVGQIVAFKECIAAGDMDGQLAEVINIYDKYESMGMIELKWLSSGETGYYYEDEFTESAFTKSNLTPNKTPMQPKQVMETYRELKDMGYDPSNCTFEELETIKEALDTIDTILSKYN